MWKKQMQPGEKVPLKLTATERKLILEDLMCLDQDYEQIIRSTPRGKPATANWSPKSMTRRCCSTWKSTPARNGTWLQRTPTCWPKSPRR